MVARWKQAFLRPWLLLPVTWAHDLSPKFLRLCYSWRSSKRSKKHRWQSKQWKGLDFRNPVGIAGGVDKNAESVCAWWALGAGFVEVGTVTPFPQKANPGLTLARDLNLKALWNCLGFPNRGSQKIKARLQKLPSPGKRPTPIFINIGKNRWTSNEDAHHDYCQLIEDFFNLADALVINISSPNTKGLRDLFDPENFKKFLSPIFTTYKKQCLAHKAHRPELILKLSPDLSEEQIQNLCLSIVNTPISGLILTNTTIQRSSEMFFEKERGGVSGLPLKNKSIEVLEKTLKYLGENRSQFLIISAGGVMSQKDVQERLQMGADLIQIYSALIFEGPGFFKQIRK